MPFIYHDGNYTPRSVDGATNGAEGRGINDDGDVVGYYNNGREHGFIYRAGTVSTFDVPGAIHTNSTTINDLGEIVGAFQDRATRDNYSFLYRNGIMRTFTLRRGKGVQSKISVTGIDDNGRVIGVYYDPPQGPSHGFVLQQRRFYGLDVPGAEATYPQAINASGQITGNFEDVSGTHGFLATPKSRAIDSDG